MTIPLPLLTQPTAVVGTTGAGKSYLSRGLVEQLLDDDRRVVVIDPTGAWWGLRSGADGDPAGGYPVTIFGGDHADILIAPEHGETIAEAIATRAVQAIIDVSEMTGGEKTRFLTDFLQTLYARNKAALHLVVDEADEVAPQNPMPDERRLSGAFDRIVRRGRIKGFRPLMITQRPAVLHKNVLSQIGTLVTLKLTSPQDRKAIEGWVQGNADKAEADTVLKSLATLDTGEGWVWSPAAGVLERQRFPQIRTFDSSRTPDEGEAPLQPALTAVDVAALRDAMATSLSGPESRAKKGSGASAAEIEAADLRGYHRGFEEGVRHGKTVGAGRALAQMENYLHNLRIPEIVAPPLSEPEVTEAMHRMEPTQRRSMSIDSPAEAQRKNRQMSKVLDDLAGPLDIPPARRRILVALRQLEAIQQTAPDKSTVAWFADASPKSSAYQNNLGALRTAGLIDYPARNCVALTTAGRDLVPPVDAPTQADLLALIRGKVPPAQMRILETLIKAWPGTIAIDVVASAAGASPTSSAFQNNRGRLRSLGLITYPAPGMLRASDILFPGGTA